MPHTVPIACSALVLVAAHAAAEPPGLNSAPGAGFTFEGLGERARAQANRSAVLTDAPPDDAPGSLRFTASLTQPGDPAPTHQPGEGAPGVPPPAPVYGARDTQWLTVGGGIAADFVDNTDVNAYLSYTYFLVDWVEVNVELGAWYHFQDNQDAAGLNPALVFRWHLIHSEDWTFYVDAGIGLLFNTDSVPEGGTHVNFTPRAGLGVTYRISESGARLQAGLRWHHISNARITGDRGNPATDAPMLYVGLIFPF
jgi:Lipid A 3-O-deacylase (PagL)